MNIGHDYRSNVIEVYVRYLREKIDRPFGVRSLETVRGVGYRLRRDGGIAFPRSQLARAARVEVLTPRCDFPPCCANAEHRPRSAVSPGSIGVPRTSPNGYALASSRSSITATWIESAPRLSSRPGRGGGECGVLSLRSLSQPGAGDSAGGGIPLIDNVGDHIFTRVHEGEPLTLDGGNLVNSTGTVVAEGTLYTPKSWRTISSTPGLAFPIRSRRLPKTR